MKSLPSRPAPVNCGPVDSPLLSRLLLLLEIPRAVIAAASPRTAFGHSKDLSSSCDSSLELMRGLDVVEHDLSSFEFQRMFEVQAGVPRPAARRIDLTSV
jgi:hypothetical protein